MDIREILKHIDRVRNIWNMKEDPGVGTHDIGCGYTLKVIDDEIKSGKVRRTYIAKLGDDPLTMSESWELFSNNLTRKEGRDMSKPSINDKDLRDRIRRKCKNDWDIDLNDDQISMCIIEMHEQKLSLFHNQIWPNRRKYKLKIFNKDGSYKFEHKERITWDKSIDGYRAIAHRGGAFAGIDAPEFTIDDENQMVCKVTVYALDRNNNRCPYVGEARFSEFVQTVDDWKDNKVVGKKPNSQWSESPRNQLSIAAERQALRKAFQDCVDDSDVPIDVPVGEPDSGSSEAYEKPPTMEERNIQAPESAKESKAVAATVVAKMAPAKKEQTKNVAGTTGPAAGSDALPHFQDNVYVGLPSGGYKPGMKYNATERIVMCAQKKLDWVLALDSGKRVKINNGGFEIERIDRIDQKRGGADWAVENVYYDGGKIVGVANSKNDELALWLALDNGFKVCLDRWGREVKRKELAKKDAAVDNDKKDTQAAPPATENADSIDNVSDIAIARKMAGDVLKKWCIDVAHQRLSYKEAYQKISGINLPKGQSMSLDDYKVLYDALTEAIRQV